MTQAFAALSVQKRQAWSYQNSNTILPKWALLSW